MKKKSSLSIKLTMIMLLLLVGIIGLCWLLNHTFLEPFYIYDKQKSLMETYETINEASKEGILLEDEFDVTFEKLAANGNLNILVIDQDSVVVRSSMWEVDLLIKQVQEMFRGGIEGPGAQSKIIQSDNDCLIMRQNDKRLQSEYLILLGNLSDGGYVYIRTALESIQESAAITNRFFIAIGLVGVVIGAVIIFFVARGVSRPIKELTGLSKSMSELKFEVKYEPKKRDSAEVAELGAHMNFMSYTLEKTISDLKAANIQLKKDIEKKEQIDEMRKEFLSNVSHELKTPIALIQGYAEGLKEGVNEDTDSQDFYCEVIMDEAAKMNKMVTKLLTLNQLEFGNDIVEMTRFNITEMITQMIQANTLLAEQSGIKMFFSEENPMFVWGDQFKVEEVLTNYMSNAIHYAKNEKEIRISIKQNGELIRVCVFNTGEGIPEEELEKIWIKFYKVDKARTREYGGSGIGLSIVKAIMDSMHQEYGVNNLENGVEFWFELESSCIK